MKIINYLKSRIRKFIFEEYWLKDHIKAGMKVGNGCDIQPGLIVDHSHCWLIEIGNKVTIAPFVYILAHDASIKKALNYSKIGKVILKDNCFIGARAMIMPGVTIGENSIVAAGSVVVKSIPANTVFGGNPAKYILDVSDLIIKHKKNMKSSKIYGSKWLMQNGITTEMKIKMSSDLDTQFGYVI